MNTYPSSVFITFADGDFRYKRARDRLLAEVKSLNVYDHIHGFNLKDVQRLDPEIYQLIQNWMKYGRLKGIGYWAWKSVIIRWAALNYPGSLIHYLDAGHVVLPAEQSRKRIIAWLQEAHQLNGLAWALPDFLEIEWTKRETLESLDPEMRWWRTPQIEGGFSILPSRTAIDFVDRLRAVHLVDEGFHLTEDRSRDQFKEFKAHRHDQSIHSLVWKDMGLHFKTTETSQPGPCDAVIAARHASGYPWNSQARSKMQGAEFYLGKVQKGIMVCLGHVRYWWDSATKGLGNSS